MKTILLSIATFMTATLGSIAEEAPEDKAAVLKTLLEATQSNDLQKFKSVCDDKMQTAMTEKILTQVSGQISPVMQLGYTLDFMGVLNRGTIMTYYWKMDFAKDGTPDMLAELSMKDGKVAGFFIR